MKARSVFLIFLIFGCLGARLEAGSVSISSLDLTKVHQGWGTAQANVSVEKHQPLTINGKTYLHGLGTHADSFFAIKLDHGSTRFTANVGIDDEAGNPLAKVQFLVYGDDKILWQSGDLTYKQDAQAVDLDVSKVNTLLLAVVGIEEGDRFDHADWADANLEVSGVSPVATNIPAEDSPEILTPPVPSTPRINGPTVLGARPNSPFAYLIPASGQRPMHYFASHLPQGLHLDSTTGMISGALATRGTFDVKLKAKNDLGVSVKDIHIVIGDQIALTPPLGWSSWNCWGGNIDQGKIDRTAHAMIDSGLAQHGFSYVNIDDTWQGTRGGPYNAIQPDLKRFPDIKALVDDIHSLGLKAGIYSTPWVMSYDGRVGGSSENPQGTWDPSMPKGPPNRKILPFAIGKYHFYTNDARQWAAWGFDYLKLDWSPMEPPETREMEDALKATGRDFVLSLSNNTTGTLFHDLPEISKVANLWRISGDINDSWGSICGNAMNRDEWAPFNKPGNYNDPDMMVLGFTFGHPTHLNHNEQYTHMSLWCLLSAPIILGCDLEKLDDFTKGLLTNDEILALDQDPLCKQATVISKQGQRLVYAKPLYDGTWAFGLFNLGPVTSPVTVNWTQLNIGGKQIVRDIWRQKDLGAFDGSFTASVAPHGVVVIKLRPPH